MSAPSVPGLGHSPLRVDPPGFLTRFGYLGDRDEPPGSIVEALRRFQAFSGLAGTGILDAATETAMNRSRCALPDPDPLAFTALCGWDRTALTYSFDVD